MEQLTALVVQIRVDVISHFVAQFLHRPRNLSARARTYGVESADEAGIHSVGQHVSRHHGDAVRRRDN